MHVAVIPDGNRRWARREGVSIKDGYKKGAQKIIEFIKWCQEIPQIKHLTFFLLSTENLRKRKIDELKYIIEISKEFISQLKKEKDIYINMSINMLYKKDLLLNTRKELRKDVEELLHFIEKNLPNGSNEKNLNLLLGYGGRVEIIEAARRFENGEEEDFRNFLWVREDVDILIRTGKEKRISNFLLFQSAYAEFFFLDKYWPEVEKKDLINIINEFNQRKRNFGE